MELLSRIGLKPRTFEGRTAVVTGAARGLGEHVARGLAHLGADTILIDIRESGETVAADIRANGGKAEFLQVDLRDFEALDAMQRSLLASRGRIDILVNNAASLHGMKLIETPIEAWDDIYRTTVRASAFLISKFLPGMIANRFGVVANTVAAEGLSFGAYFSSALVGQRSMVLSLAGEVARKDGVNVFGFAPGVMDTGLVHEDDKTLEYYGLTEEEWIRDFVDNPGYDGLMPPSDSAASYIYCLAHAEEYHGQIADAFHPLISHGIITPKSEDRLSGLSDNVDAAVRQCNDYIHGISSVNRNLEVRIEARTRELEEANRQLANQKRFIEDISARISRYLPRQLYQSIFSGDSGAEIGARRKYLTVMFSDIREFTNRTERLEPEALAEALNLYFSEMTEIARAHGATIDKFIGDAILAFFGDPQTEGRERDARRCVEMAVEMQRRMTTLAPSFAKLGMRDPLEIRIGINSGFCTVGNFGSYERMDYTIIGSPVNVAARLQGAAEPGAVLVSGATQGLLGYDVPTRTRGSLSLKGIADPVEAFEAIFDRTDGLAAPASAEDQLRELSARLAKLDVEALGADEKQALLDAVARLLRP